MMPFVRSDLSFVQNSGYGVTLPAAEIGMSLHGGGEPAALAAERGGHDYPDPDGTSDCRFGCGCWMGPYRSGGPVGLDPFRECPNNPQNEARPFSTAYGSL